MGEAWLDEDIGSREMLERQPIQKGGIAWVGP